MSWIERKRYENDENNPLILVCDYAGCWKKVEGFEDELEELGWKWSEISKEGQTKRIALCPKHEGSMMDHVRRFMRGVKA